MIKYLREAINFFKEIKQEVNKLVLPPKKETVFLFWIVIIMAGISAVFFFGIDMIVHSLIRYILRNL